ncbi:MAG: thiamine-phosphate kinase [Chloroflexota bacterium]
MDGPAKLLAELGEFGAIDLFRALAASHRPRAMVPLVDIGDDAAVWTPSPGASIVATTDVLIEGVHFSPEYMSWHEVGWKAMAVNLSDIAAMGARPVAALLTVALKANMTQDAAEDLFHGLLEFASEHGTWIAGGDTVLAPSDTSVGVSLYGESSEPERLLRRNRARVGDAIAVTGHLGAAAAALWLWQHHEQPPPALRQAHTHPQPRLAQGRALAEAGTRCAMDVSDGLLADLGKLCRASGVGARIEAGLVPISPGVADYFEPEVALRLALAGGEDYELVACGQRESLLPHAPFIIGRIVEGEGVTVINEQGTALVLPHTGYDAFLPHA